MANRFEEKVLSVTKALVLLEILSGSANGLTLNDLSRQAGMNKTTVYRLLTSLLERGFAAQDERIGKYYLGTKILLLADSFFRETDIRPIVHRQLEKPLLGAPHLIVVSRIINNTLTVVDNVYSHAGHPSSLRVGTTVPFNCSAMGKVFLAFLPDRNLLDLLTAEALIARTARSITSPSMLREAVQMVAYQRFADEDEEYEEGVSALAVPIFDYTRSVIAALGISYPVKSVSEVDKSKLALNMLEYSEKISAKLGYYSH